MKATLIKYTIYPSYQDRIKSKSKYLLKHKSIKE